MSYKKNVETFVFKLMLKITSNKCLKTLAVIIYYLCALVLHNMYYTYLLVRESFSSCDFACCKQYEQVIILSEFLIKKKKKAIYFLCQGSNMFPKCNMISRFTVILTSQFVTFKISKYRLSIS